jgi:hypothetical protein
MQQESYLRAGHWKRPFWLSLLVAASIAFSFGFACATPFAALCAAAVCTLPRRDGYYLAGAVWATNQFIGFAFLNYPWTANCLGWGLAIGLSALLCTLVAGWTTRRLTALHPWAGYSIAFLAAFAAYEAALIAFSLSLGGTENFTPGILVRVFVINAVASVGLFALNWAGVFIGIQQSRAEQNAAADRGRHSGFPRPAVSQGGPGG